MTPRPGCYNTPRDFTGKYTAQAGWSPTYEDRGVPVRVPVYVEVTSRFELGCKYDKAAEDASCAGCCNQSSTNNFEEEEA